MITCKQIRVKQTFTIGVNIFSPFTANSARNYFSIFFLAGGEIMIYLKKWGDWAMAFRKPKLYLDSSVFIGYFDDDEDERERKDVTRRFFEVEAPSQRYELVSSELVLQALENVLPGANLVDFAKSLPVVYFPMTDEVNRLAQKIITERLIDNYNFKIAPHLAFALLQQVKYIVSWDFKHMFKPRTKKAVKMMSLQKGVLEIKIITPEAVVISGDDV
jgi:hypothetical protein